MSIMEMSFEDERTAVRSFCYLVCFIMLFMRQLMPNSPWVLPCAEDCTTYRCASDACLIVHRTTFEKERTAGRFFFANRSIIMCFFQKNYMCIVCQRDTV